MHLWDRDDSDENHMRYRRMRENGSGSNSWNFARPSEQMNEDDSGVPSLSLSLSLSVSLSLSLSLSLPPPPFTLSIYIGIYPRAHPESTYGRRFYHEEDTEHGLGVVTAGYREPGSSSGYRERLSASRSAGTHNCQKRPNKVSKET